MATQTELKKKKNKERVNTAIMYGAWKDRFIDKDKQKNHTLDKE